jgi:hypothetical protein
MLFTGAHFAGIEDQIGEAVKPVVARSEAEFNQLSAEGKLVVYQEPSGKPPPGPPPELQLSVGELVRNP